MGGHGGPPPLEAGADARQPNLISQQRRNHQGGR